jgi:hypothetical protein
MAPIQLLTHSVPVAALHWALQEHPELWNENTARTEPVDSPHHGLSDIWARWAPAGVDGSQPHDAVWYPCVSVLPIIPIVRQLMTYVKGTRLGGVLITRIPPGGMCRPHTDPGWHARYYEKFAVQVTSAPGQKFCFDDEELEARPGDVYWFDNSHTHWVVNDSRYERITAIVCIKRGD